MTQLVPVRSCRSVAEAQMFRDLLQHHGIPAHLDNHYTHAVHGFLAEAAGGVQVLVEQRQLEEAEAALNALASFPPIDEDDEGDKDDPHSPQPGSTTLCPACHSLTVAPRRPIAFLLSLVFLPLFFLTRPRSYRCLDCGCRFRRRATGHPPPRRG